MDEDRMKVQSSIFGFGTHRMLPTTFITKTLIYGILPVW